MPVIFDTPVKYGLIEAKPTWYAGILFDSKLEANVAKQLDYDAEEWVYHPESFYGDEYTGFGNKYTPDFFLPEHNIYLEVCTQWDKRHEHCVKTFSQAHKIVVIDGQGRFCNTEGEPEPQLFGRESIFDDYDCDAETLYSQGVRRKADEMAADSIAATAPQRKRDYLSFKEFAEKCGMAFVRVDEFDRPDISRMTEAQAQMAHNLNNAYYIYMQEHWTVSKRERALDKLQMVLDAIYRVCKIGGQAKLQDTNSYALKCRYQNAMVKTGPLTYYPTTGTIKGKSGTGISGINDFIAMLEGKTDAEIRAMKTTEA
jgi:hypothetical protein